MTLTRRDFLKSMGATAAVASAPSALQASPARKPMNVLMIPVDDLRPQLGCYGAKQIISPNIDRLGKAGTVFRRAYTMVATCSPSRTCLLTGCRPDTTLVYDLVTHFRKTLPENVTLMQHFMNHGYESVGMGKVFHGSLNDDLSWDRWIDTKTATWLNPETLKRIEELKKEADKKGLKGKDKSRMTRGTVTEGEDVPDNGYEDGKIADQAIIELKAFAKSGKPFFLAAGFKKPHLAFIAPKRYWDLYKREDIEVADNPYHPKGMPKGAVDGFPGEMNSYFDARELANKQKKAGKNDFPEAFAKKLIHGYYACVSYIDAQVGRLLDTLEETGLTENTVVVLWGDHGWHLGENGTWGKHTNLEWGTHSPLILRIPGQKNPGVPTDALAEFVDVYPTIADSCGLPVPKHCEGISLVPLTEKPDRPWKKAAFSQFVKTINGVRSMGYTMRTDQFRYTQWRKRSAMDEIVACELYDHRENHDENENVINDPSLAKVVARMEKQMEAGWKSALPK